MLKGLNEQQIDAIKQEGNVLLTACPGSGKTRALTYKIAYELSILPHSKKKIIAVTFTNRAADEIKKRLRDLNIDDSNLWAGTIHAFCLEWIIRPNMCYLEELKNGFAISDEFNSESLLESLKKKYNLNFFTSISTKYNTNGQKQERFNIKLVNEYHEILSSQKLIDFDQILHYAYKILSQLSKVCETLKNMFHLICVDEYQDTQELQYAILSEIMKAKTGNCNIFLVGDEDQAIYGSLGGVAKSIEEIQIQFGNLEVVSRELSGNYRSNQQIIDYYRNYQTSSIEIEAVGENADDDALITYNSTIHKDDLESYIAHIIKDKLLSGIPEHEICILAPTWYMVIPMGRKLKAMLPDVSFDAVGLSPLQKNQENFWFKVARLFLIEPSPKNYSLRQRWSKELISEMKTSSLVNTEDDKFTSKQLLKLINSTTSDQKDGLKYLEECFILLFQKLEIDIINNDFIQLHWKTFFDGANVRLAKPEFNMATEIDSFKKMFKHESGIVVNTCHGIKGEEFDTVIAFGLLHGKLPNWNDNSDETANKLLYVICSRAKRELHLISEVGHTTQRGILYEPTQQLYEVVYEYSDSPII
jgi:DNA helicase II / ATP-dependent DNA helicase PcrA